jgi:hypothetical protein
VRRGGGGGGASGGYCELSGCQWCRSLAPTFWDVQVQGRSDRPPLPRPHGPFFWSHGPAAANLGAWAPQKRGVNGRGKTHGLPSSMKHEAFNEARTRSPLAGMA